MFIPKLSAANIIHQDRDQSSMCWSGQLTIWKKIFGISPDWVHSRTKRLISLCKCQSDCEVPPSVLSPTLSPLLPACWQWNLQTESGRTRNQSKQSIFYKSFRQGCVLEADIVFRSLSKHSGAVLPLATGHKWWNKLPQPFAMGLQVFEERCLLSFATTWFYSVTSVLPESTEVLASCIWLTFSSIICSCLPLWIGVVCEGKKLN